MRVVVIGAGIAGLAAAGRLARAGYEVTVLEKTGRPGGRASLIQEEGYTFDTGPSLLLMPDTYRQAYADLGERMEDHLDLVQIDPTYRVHFSDGSTLNLGNDLVSLREQLDRMEPGAFGRMLEFTRRGYERYNASLERVVGRNFYRAGDFFNVRNLPLLLSLKPLSTHYADTSRYFRDPRLRAAFSFQNMYLGLSPFGAPATYSLLQFTEMGEGVWYPRGGMYGIVTSLRDIAEGYGARFFYDTPVSRILVDSDRARGVALENGERVGADVVVANADLPYVYRTLLQERETSQRLDRLQYTSSALMFYWGIEGERSPQLFHHNVFLAEDRYRQSFDRIFRDHDLPDDPSFYIHAPVRTAAGFAPPTADALMVLVPTGHLDSARQQDWPELQARARACVVERLAGLGVQNLEKRIVFERTLTPPDYESTWSLTKGSAFGLSHNITQVGYLRPANRHRRIGNLYFAGASTHPGTGVPIVLISARLATERILKEQPLD